MKKEPLKTRFKKNAAYFSMEIGLEDSMKTYAGGLGILAGDTLKSAADLGLKVYGISILYKFGYFKQYLNEEGQQIEVPDEWDFRNYLTFTGKVITFDLKGESVSAEIWKYEVLGVTGHVVPVYFLNTDIDSNSQANRYISFNLYTPFEDTRLRQEITLGIGGIKALEELGHDNLDNYHLNESHAVFSILALEEKLESREEVVKKIVFTTHTPAEHGHKKYNRDTLEYILHPTYMDLLRKDFDGDELHLTKFGLRNAKYSNGVSKLHGQVSSNMFPEFKIDFVTNGIHANTWAGSATSEVLKRFVKGWEKSPGLLTQSATIPEGEILEMHQANKQELMNYVKVKTGNVLDVNTFTIGFARRVDGYKRSGFIFRNMSVLTKIAKKFGGLQIIFSGKAYFDYGPSEDIIKNVFKHAKEDLGLLKVIFLEDYGMYTSQMMVQGCDIWLNNPIKPLEASGTSGMKAALNGVPSLSTIDGWWVEGWEEGFTGWSIGSEDPYENDEEHDLYDMYSKLEFVVIPMWKEHKVKWARVQRNCIAKNASYFNTHRMVEEYVEKGYSL